MTIIMPTTGQTFTLDKEVEAVIYQLVEHGRYESPMDVLEAALRALDAQHNYLDAIADEIAGDQS